MGHFFYASPQRWHPSINIRKILLWKALHPSKKTSFLFAELNNDDQPGNRLL
jgi:hypothetical protein